MSIVALAGVVPLLLARRQWLALVVTIAVALVASCSFWVTHGEALKQKAANYSPVNRSRTALVLPPAPSYVEPCLQRLEEAAHRSVTVTEAKYSCSYVLQFADYDARMRLVLHAVETNRSSLFGSGVGSYLFFDAARSDYPVGRYIYPHNIAADVFHSSGLIGLALIGFVVSFAAAAVLRTCFITEGPVAILAAIPLFSGLMSLVGGDIYDGRFLWIMPVVLGALGDSADRAREASAR